MMRPLFVLSLSSALLAACASAPEPEAKPQAGAADTPSFRDSTPLTGSRFSKSGTDRNLRVIGNDAARTEIGQDVRSISNTVGARGN